MIDPLSENYQSLSPYIYTDNNPINNTDPDGQYVLYGADAQAFFGALKQKPYNPPKKTEEEKAKERQDAFDNWNENMLAFNKLAIEATMLKDLIMGLPRKSVSSLSNFFTKWLSTSSKSPTAMSFVELQKAAGSFSKEMNAFFNSKGRIVPSKEALETYKELASRIVNNSGGSTVRTTEKAIQVHVNRINMINGVLNKIN